MHRNRWMMGLILLGTFVTGAAGAGQAERDVARENIQEVKRKLEDEVRQIFAADLVFLRLNCAVMGNGLHSYTNDGVRDSALLTHRKPKALGLDWLSPNGWGLTNRDEIIELRKEVVDGIHGKGPLGKVYFSSILGPLSQLGEEVLEIDAGRETNTVDNRYCRERVATLYGSIRDSLREIQKEHLLARDLYQKQLDEYNRLLGTNVTPDLPPGVLAFTISTGTDSPAAPGAPAEPTAPADETKPMRILGQTAAAPTATPPPAAIPAAPAASPLVGAGPGSELDLSDRPAPPFDIAWSEFDAEVRDLRAALEQYRRQRSAALRARLIEARKQYLEAARELDTVIATSPDPGDIERFGEIRAGVRNFWRGTVITAAKN